MPGSYPATIAVAGMARSYIPSDCSKFVGAGHARDTVRNVLEVYHFQLKSKVITNVTQQQWRFEDAE